ncbi:hypothetical protein ACHAPA_012107 [Fusarium lateritium]
MAVVHKDISRYVYELAVNKKSSVGQEFGGSCGQTLCKNVNESGTYRMHAYWIMSHLMEQLGLMYESDVLKRTPDLESIKEVGTALFLSQCLRAIGGK